MSKKKYVIETAFENMGIQKIMQLGLDDNGRIINWTDSIEDVEELNSDYINEYFGSLQDEAYQRGINDGSLDVKQRVEGAYQRGLEDAWAAAKRIFGYEIDGGIPINNVREAFGYAKNAIFCTADIIRDYTAQEAIDKIKAYDGKHSDSIEVWDEVEAAFGTAVVVCCDYDENKASYIYSSGKHGFDNTWNLTKTGKHYDIASILEAMRK